MKIFLVEICRRPQKPCDWLERCRRHFELLHKPGAQHFKAGSYSKQQVAKNNLAAEPSQGFCSRLESDFYLDRIRHIPSE